MRAVVLAAGVGARLREAWAHPKCLVPVGGEPLLWWYLDALREIPVDDVVLVTGYERRQVERFLAHGPSRPKVRAIFNPDFVQGSIRSLHVAGPWLADPVLLMDGDVFFEREVLRRVMAAPGEVVALDPSTPYAEEAYRAEVEGARVVRLGRGLLPSPGGEWVGFARLSPARASRLAALARSRIEAGESAGGYEDALAATIAEDPLPWVSVAGLTWVEIDTPADLARAERLSAAVEQRGERVRE